VQTMAHVISRVYSSCVRPLQPRPAGRLADVGLGCVRHEQEVAAAARLVLLPEWADQSRHMRWAAALSAATLPEVCPIVLFDCARMLQLLGLKCAVHWVDIYVAV
jgi:hypothetical protein